MNLAHRLQGQVALITGGGGEIGTAIALLATIITTTPGTVSCTIDEERNEILVHALNCDDPAQMAADIKARYEAPLLAIFEAVQPTVAAVQGDRV